MASLSNSFSSSLAELRTALTTVGNKPTTLSKADTINLHALHCHHQGSDPATASRMTQLSEVG
eukprot:SAG25_NODE_398_length_8498_cov_16.527206_7_plen_63_part_00